MDERRLDDERDVNVVAFGIGNWIRQALGGSRGPVNLLLLLTIVVGIAGGAASDLVPEGPRRWYLVALAASVAGVGVFVWIWKRNAAVLGATLYIASVDAGLALEGFDDRRWLWLVGASAVIGGLIFMREIVRSVRAERELERFISMEATSIAFFVTMIAALTYALLELYADLPRLTMWVPWSVGMGTWAVASVTLRKRMS